MAADHWPLLRVKLRQVILNYSIKGLYDFYFVFAVDNSINSPGMLLNFDGDANSWLCFSCVEQNFSKSDVICSISAIIRFNTPFSVHDF